MLNLFRLLLITWFMYMRNSDLFPSCLRGDLLDKK